MQNDYSLKSLTNSQLKQNLKDSNEKLETLREQKGKLISEMLDDAVSKRVMTVAAKEMNQLTLLDLETSISFTADYIKLLKEELTRRNDIPAMPEFPLYQKTDIFGCSEENKKPTKSGCWFSFRVSWAFIIVLLLIWYVIS